MALHAYAAERCAVAPLLLGACSPPPSISCLHAAHQQTRCMPLLPSNDEKKTDVRHPAITQTLLYILCQ